MKINWKIILKNKIHNYDGITCWNIFLILFSGRVHIRWQWRDREEKHSALPFYKGDNKFIYQRTRKSIKFEQFKLLFEREVNYSKFYENFYICDFMQQVDLENYTRHDHLLAYNEILREFYAHLEPVMGNNLCIK